MPETIRIKELRRSEYNPRIMPETEMRALKESIMVFGFVEPVVVNTHECEACGSRKGVLVGGHQRTIAVEELLAAGKTPQGIRLGEVKDETNPIEIAELPAIFVDFHLEQEKALNLALNKIKGKWDEEKLTEIIIELKGSPLIPATGFREDEVSRILDRGLLPDEDEEGMGEGEADLPNSQPGELYILGDHRLVCGDATDPEAYQKLLGDQKADIVFTDPPYNVAYHSRGEGLKGEGKEELKNDDLTPEQFARLIDRSFFEMLQRMRAGAAAYICSGWSSYPQFLQSLIKAGFEHSGVIIWVKNAPSMGWNDYRYKHEWIARARRPEGKKAGGIVYGWRKGAPHQFYAETEFDVWDMPRKAVTQYLHPTEKPDWLAMRALRNSSKRGEIVLDPFAGSGSVMAAAEKTGRRAYMIEIDPKFCDEIRKRWARIEKAKQAQTAKAT